MPDWAVHLRPRLSRLQLGAAREAEVVEELSQHLQQRFEELRSGGASDADARRLAIDELLELDALADHMRSLRQAHVPPPITPGAPTRFLLADLWQDLRYAARMLRKQPGFTVVAVLTLALGIGANTAIFSLINAAVLRALPFFDSERLVVIWAESTSARKQGVPFVPPANADIADWRGHTESFAGIGAFSARTADLVDGDSAERVGAAGVTAGFFATLGVTPVLGRTMAADEEVPGGPPVVLIGYGLWQRRFGGDPALIGRSITVNRDTRTVVGIMPPDFDFPRGAEWPAFFSFSGQTEVWLPLALRAREDGTGWSNWQSRGERGLIAIGRIKPGADLERAQAEMDTFAARLAHDHPESHKDTSLKLVPLRQQMAGHSYRSLLILFVAVGLLLLIACVNVANLLLARGVARRQEIAVRAALGAGYRRLMRQLFAECLLLGVFGSGLGVLVAAGCLKVFLVLNPLTYSRLDEASLDPAALGFAALITIVTSAVFGLVPALQSSRTDLRSSLHEGGRAADGTVRERVRGWLVATEVALALVLLTTAGLMVRSFMRVQAIQPGFRSDSVLAFDVQLPTREADDSSRGALFEQLTARLEELPGVRAAGAISLLPLGGGENMGGFAVEGEPPVDSGNRPTAERRWVTPGYFAAMGIAIRKGRVFTSQDSAGQPRVVLINETIARQFFGSGHPVDRRLMVGGHWRTIVGVVSDVKSGSLESDVRPQIYLPYAQDPWPPMTVVVRTEGDPLALASAVRNESKALDRLLLVTKMRTMERMVSNASSARRFNMALLTFFAVAALLLTMMGIYGVIAFLAGRRRREIGIRMALGAKRGDILRLVLRQGMKPVALGGLCGLIGSLVASRLVASQLYGVSASDPLTLTSIVVLLGAAALLACWLPAHRATQVHPVEALRRD